MVGDKNLAIITLLIIVLLVFLHKNDSRWDMNHPFVASLIAGAIIYASVVWYDTITGLK
jgi:hypothetical protein